MNYLERFARLRNEYFVLRHGESIPLVAKIIISSFGNGVLDEYSLTDEGERQVRESAICAKFSGMFLDDAVIFSSPFSRTKRTAEIFGEELNIKKFLLDDRLRERSFGKWEKAHSDNYQNIWDEDAKDPSHRQMNVESVLDVQDRVTSFIMHCEELYSMHAIVIVSHGDVLQILRASFEGILPSMYRSIPYLEVAQLRRLAFKGEQV